MSQNKSVVLVVATTVVLSVTSPLFAQRLSTSLPSQRMLDRYGLELAWWSQAVMKPSRDRVRYVTIDEENVYVQATSGVVTAFDNETGRRLWARQLGPRDAPSYAAASNKDDVMVVAGMTLFSVEKFRGGIKWQVRLPKQPSTSPAVDDQNVYVGSLDGSIYAINLRKIRELYNEDLLPQYAGEAVRWRYKTAKEVTTPAITDGLVVNFASRDGSLYSISAGERQLRWQFETDKPVSAPMARAKDSVILASEDFRVYRVANQSGRVNWDFVSGYPVRRSPRVIGEQVFLFPERGGMFCLSVDTGVELWWRPKIVDFVGATRTRVFTSDRIGNVVILSRKDGALIGALPLRQFSARPGNDRTDRIYLATQSGLVICIRTIGQEFPIFHMFPEQLPILPEFAPEPSSEDGQGDNPETGTSTENNM